MTGIGYQNPSGENLPAFMGLSESERILFMRTHLNYQVDKPSLARVIMKDPKAMDIVRAAYSEERLEDLTEEQQRSFTDRLGARIRELEAELGMD